MLASWSVDRIMSQQCGLPWLQTFTEINGVYNSGRQLDALQLVTWNDYEEATEIETGIDNCLSVTATLSGSSLQWSITGKENTVDHYIVYVSTDGENLMGLDSLLPGSRSLNLSSYPLAAGTYTLYVQAAGKPTLKNQISGPVKYTVPAGTGAAPGPGIVLTASPAAITVTPGRSGSASITVTPQSGGFDSAVTFSCPGLPGGVSCAFSPSSVVPGGGPVTSMLTIASSPISVIRRPEDLRRGHSLYAVGLSGLGIPALVIVGLGQNRRRKFVIPVVLVLLTGCLLFLSACGGGASPSQNRAPGSQTGVFTITVSGTSGSVQSSTTVTLTVR